MMSLRAAVLAAWQSPYNMRLLHSMRLPRPDKSIRDDIGESILLAHRPDVLTGMTSK